MSSSVPDFGLEAHRYLEQARRILAPDEGELQTRRLTDEDVARAQAFATLGHGFAVLAVSRQIAESAPLRP